MININNLIAFIYHDYFNDRQRLFNLSVSHQRKMVIQTIKSNKRTIVDIK